MRGLSSKYLLIQKNMCFNKLTWKHIYTKKNIVNLNVFDHTNNFFSQCINVE